MIKEQQLILRNTPVESYLINQRQVYVKREDLCISEAGFSKLRGVASHLEKLDPKIDTIGVLDSRHSKAGWGTSYLCKQLGKKCVVFYPKLKNETTLREGQTNALRLGAYMMPQRTLKSCVLWHIAKKHMATGYSNGYMLPNGLKLDETLVETTNEVGYCDPKLFSDTTWVISISTGTIALGVIQGLIKNNAKVKVILHMGYSRSYEEVLRYILKGTKLTTVGLPISGSVTEQRGKKKWTTNYNTYNLSNEIALSIVDEGYQYKDLVEFDCPFPCNQYYDLKCWKWLSENINRIKTENIMFWNIGC